MKTYRTEEEEFYSSNDEDAIKTSEGKELCRVYWILYYSANGEELERYSFDSEKEAEEMAKKLSIEAHSENPDDINEKGEIFIMDWEKFNKRDIYSSGNGKFIPYISYREEYELVKN